MTRLFNLSVMIVMISMAAALVGSVMVEWDSAYSLSSASDNELKSFQKMQDISGTYSTAGQDLEQTEGAVNPDADLASSILTTSLRTAKQLLSLPSLFFALLTDADIVLAGIGIPPAFIFGLFTLALIATILGITALIFKMRP